MNKYIVDLNLPQEGNNYLRCRRVRQVTFDKTNIWVGKAFLELDQVS
jgi:hypothetical protein